MKIRFLSRNKHKFAEVKTILASSGIEIEPLETKIPELQTQDIEEIVKDKCLRAFGLVGRSVLVEHTGLYLKALNGLPGGLTQVFWDSLEADRFAALFGVPTGPNGVEARTVFGYCDAKKIRLFSGSVTGTVPAAPRGRRDFQWDCVFVPDGYTQTFAEMGDEKNKISMRRRALDEFVRFYGRPR